MSNQNNQSNDPTDHNRQRDYHPEYAADDLAVRRADALDRLTCAYADAYYAGEQPNAAAYIRRYPQYARELAEFLLYFHTIEVDLPDGDDDGANNDPQTSLPELSPAARKAQERIRRQWQCAMN